MAEESQANDRSPQEGGETGEAEGRLSRQDLMGAFWRYLFWFQSGWNYERMQAPGYAHAMKPIIKKLYPDPENRREALETHLEFFNTQPFMAAPILGANIALEERSQGGIPKEAVTGLKAGMMGPFAGIGDSFFFAIYNTIIFSIGSYLALDGSIAGPILVFLLTIIPFTLFRYWTFWQGYKQGTRLVAQMAGGMLRRLTDAATILGLVVVGALIPTIITTQIAYVYRSGEVEVNLQEQLNTILPSMVPVLFVGLTYWLLSRGVSPTVLVFVLLGLGILLGALGILTLPEV
jgi:PTS system mannose-specific IID component